MAEQKQNPAKVIALIVVIVIALMFVVKAAKPKKYPRPDVDWTCEACGEQFVGQAARSPSKCPYCGKMEAVTSIWYRCEKCEEVFEAFRSKSVPPESASGPETFRPGKIFIKTPDGDWVRDMSEEGRKIGTQMKCPGCGNDDLKTLTHSPPHR